MGWKDWTSLHNHTSRGSFLDGMGSPEEMMERAAKLDMPSLAITDHGGCFGHVAFQKAGLKHGVKPIFGIEAYYSVHGRKAKPPTKKERELNLGMDDGGQGYICHITLLAETHDGLINLRRLSNLSWIEGFYRNPRIDAELLERLSDGIICLSGCLSGPVLTYLKHGEKKAAEKQAGILRDLFGPDRFYLEIQPGDFPEQKSMNVEIRKLAKRMGLRVVLTLDSHYARPQDAKTHDILLCCQTGASLSAEKRMRFPAETFYLRSAKRVAKTYDAKKMMDSMEAAAEIAARCNVTIPLHSTGTPIAMPEFPLPDGETEESLLAKQVTDALETRAPWEKPGPRKAGIRQKDYEERRDHELTLINKLKFPGYFLILADLIRTAKNAGIPVGPGRGSGAASICAYALRITEQVDPLLYDLPFSRFLNEARTCMAPWVEVATDRGCVSIAELTLGDEVLTRGGLKPLLQIHRRHTDVPLYELHYRRQDGSTGVLTSTGCHAIYAYKGTKITEVKVADVKVGESLVCLSAVQSNSDVVPISRRNPKGVQQKMFEPPKGTSLDQTEVQTLRKNVRNQKMHSQTVLQQEMLVSDKESDKSMSGLREEVQGQQVLQPAMLGSPQAQTMANSGMPAMLENFHCESERGYAKVLLQEMWGNLQSLEVLHEGPGRIPERPGPPSAFENGSGFRETTPAFQHPIRIRENDHRTRHWLEVSTRLLRAIKRYLLRDQGMARARCQEVEGNTSNIQETQTTNKGNLPRRSEKDDRKVRTAIGRIRNVLSKVVRGVQKRASHLSGMRQQVRQAVNQEQRNVQPKLCDAPSMVEGTITEIRRIPYSGLVYDLSVAERQEYFAEGCLVHNSPPDIDVDVSQRYRGKFLAMIREKYGEDRVVHIATYSGMGARGALKDAGRVLEVPFEVSNSLTKQVPDIKDFTVEASIDEIQGLREQFDSINPEWVKIANRLQGTPRQPGRHPGGICIAPKPIENYFPVYTRTEKGGKRSAPIAQGDMHDVEEMLIKFDLLGLKTLDVVFDACASLKEHEGVDLHPYDIPLDDTKAYALLSLGRTEGIFQLASEKTKNILRAIEPANVEDVSLVSALIRPGAEAAIDHIVACKRGEAEPVYPFPDLEPILKSTYGDVVYQEQIMRVAGVVCGFSPVEQDALRKGVGKKDAKLLARQKDKFFAGAKKQKRDLAKVEFLWEGIEKAAKYSFNLAHSLAYSIVGVWAAHMKANYPVHFFAALLTAAEDKKERARYARDARRFGITILPPDIRLSRPEFRWEDGCVRFGLEALDGFGENACKALEALQHGWDQMKATGKYRTRVPKRAGRLLVHLADDAEAISEYDLRVFRQMLAMEPGNMQVGFQLGDGHQVWLKLRSTREYLETTVEGLFGENGFVEVLK